MTMPQISAQDAMRIRSPNAIGLFQLAQERGWTDEEIAAAYNSQAGVGGTWGVAKVAEHRTWLQNAGMLGAAPVAPVAAGGNFAMIDGVRWNMTRA